MKNDADPSRLPLGLVAINWAGGALIITSVVVMAITKPAAASATRTVFEVLMGAGALCYLVYAYRYWQWRKRRRERRPSDPNHDRKV